MNSQTLAPKIGATTENADRLKPGSRISHYDLLGYLGSGGMGDVYLAKDHNLERRVALKLLNKKFVNDEERVSRFVLEAKAASALNHPNIITIYEIGTSAESSYIAAEHIDGVTLHEWAQGRTLDISAILDTSIQIAQALSAAHKAGIAHRDIKPENVMIREDGYVKVLDFGLAKLTERGFFPNDFDADTQKMFATRAGSVMGTVSYMSPEQARGKNVDTRTDIWSLGVVMYELITGKQPFVGETTSDILAELLRADPIAIATHRHDVPPELARIVNKALRKNRENRYQAVKDLLIDLQDIRQELNLPFRKSRPELRVTDVLATPANTEGELGYPLDTGATAKARTRTMSDIIITQARLHPILLLAGAFIVFIGAIFAGVRFVQGFRGPSPFQAMSFSKLTYEGNVESGEVAISEDGKYAVYATREEKGGQALWIRNVATGSSVQIAEASDINYTGLTFSPEGDRVYFSSAGKDDVFSVYSIPILGGESRLVVSAAAGPVTFAPDGKTFAFIRDYKTLMISDLDGRNLRSLADAAEGIKLTSPQWSPDGGKIVAAGFSNRDANVHLMEFATADGASKQIPGDGWLRINAISWLPSGDAVLVTGRDLKNQLSQIWHVSYPSGAAVRVTNDTGNYYGLSITANGKSAVTVQSHRTSNIWIGPEGNVEAAQRITRDVGQDEGMSGLTWAPDGRVVYSTKNTGREDLWVMDGDGRNNRQLTQNSGSNFSPAVSPDGKYIYFVSDRSGTTDMWRMEFNGGNSAVQITDGPEIESRPSITLDGRWIVYHITQSDGSTAVWKRNTDGTAPILLTESSAGRPVLSPDGKFIAAAVGTSGSSGPPAELKLIPIDGGEQKSLLTAADAAPSVYRWSADGKSLIYLESRDMINTLWVQPLAGGPRRKIADRTDERIYNFDISRFGHGMVIAKGTESSDVVVLTDFR